MEWRLKISKSYKGSINHNYNLIGAYMDPDQEFGTLKRPKAANFVIRDKNFKV